jgi:RecJ-like exonuclease
MITQVDLTAQRDFRFSARYNYFPKNKPYKLHEMIFSAIPNIEYANDFEDACPKDNWGIFQGDSNVRKIKRRVEGFSDYVTCDCCGKQLYPYYQDTLCTRCKLDHEYEIPKWKGNII